jgi:hypothetical protein
MPQEAEYLRNANEETKEAIKHSLIAFKIFSTTRITTRTTHRNNTMRQRADAVLDASFFYNTINSMGSFEE